MQLVLVPIQVIDDSPPEVEERVSLPDISHGHPTALLLEQAGPDSIQAPGEVAQEPVLTSILHELPAEEDPNAIPNEEAAVTAGEIVVENPTELVLDVVGQEHAPYAPQAIEAGEAGENPEPMPEAVPVEEPLEALPVAEQPPPSTLERLARLLKVTPPWVVDDAREGLRRLLGPDILIPCTPARVLEYLRVLLCERVITEDQYQEVDELLQNLPQGLNERAVATAQTRQTETHFQTLAQQTDAARDFLGDRANLIRELTLKRNHLWTQIQDLQARLTDVMARLAQAEPQLEQPFTAFETLTHDLAQAHVATQQATQAAADASFHLDKLFLRLTRVGRRLLGLRY
ncbi:uncharacterized protein LOC112189594 [Rosa chinensis]|uniref:uncharacterized protein LOC112189594 n=1 Tax=Rosa chinensis TaxID=74649 RepID=UPI000D08C411|nr:uncharacterized protein LOC112189594 [Rosa chinensis]XP_024184706.1 uncharacterized protein LOC112189594 [Rosa chinensis]